MIETHASEKRLAVRHVQLLRALFAALAAAMITFSPDHSAAVGLAVFSGFAIATGLIFAISAWLTYPTGRRAGAVLLAVVTLGAGMATGIGPLRSIGTFFIVVIAWSAASGLIEGVAALRTVRRFRAEAQSPGTAAQSADDGVEGTAAPPDARAIPPASRRPGALPARWQPADAPGTAPVTDQERSEARDGIVVGALTVVLGLALLLIPAGFQLDYAIDDAGSFTLTGATIAVGLYGGYVAILAVYLGIAGFSPRRSEPAPSQQPDGAVESSPTPSAVPHDASTEQRPGGRT